MKKSVILALMAVVLGFTFTSCKEDTQPRLSKPSNFVLNTPPMADQLYIMAANTSINLSVSQPDYGVATTPNYQVEIARTADGFEKGEYRTLESMTTLARINVSGEEFCLALCDLWGYDTPEKFDASPRPVYVRVHAWVPNAEYSSIYSNVIALNVKPYFAVKVSDTIQLVGQPEGWQASVNEAWLLYETEPGNLVYQGTFEIPEDQFQFRFYDKFDAAEPWDWFSIGAQDEDKPVKITLTDGNYSGPCIYDPDTKGAGKGSWQIDGWAGGTVQITVNLKTKMVSFSLVQ